MFIFSEGFKNMVQYHQHVVLEILHTSRVWLPIGIVNRESQLQALVLELVRMVVPMPYMQG